MTSSRFDPRVLRHDRDRRGTLLHIADQALSAVDPETAVAAAFVRDGERVRIGPRSLDLGWFSRLVVIGFGKAADGMGRAIASILDGVPMSGVLVTPDLVAVPPFEVIVGGHPIPDAGSVTGVTNILLTSIQ